MSNTRSALPKFNLLKVSFFLTYVTMFLTVPFFSLSTIQAGGKWRFIIGAFIWISPNVAQASTLLLFNRIAEKSHKEKNLILLGYSITLIQFLVLSINPLLLKTAYILLILSFIFNLFTVAYIPAIKALITRVSAISQRGKVLGSINTIMSMGFGIGMLVGSFIYQLNPENAIEKLVNLSLILATIAIGIFLFSMKYEINNKGQKGNFNEIFNENTIELEFLTHNSKKNTKEKLKLSDLDGNHIKIKQKKMKEKEINVKINIPFTFSTALKIQFTLTFFSSMFFSLFGPYLAFLNYSITFFGIANAIAALLGIIAFQFFGKLLDKHGPLFLYHYAWIVYVIVYTGLLSRNIYIIMSLWILPGYSFYIATEYIATQTASKEEYAQSIAKVQSNRTFALIGGNLFSGILMIFLNFNGVLITSLIGLIICGILLISFSIHSKNPLKKDN